MKCMTVFVAGVLAVPVAVAAQVAPAPPAPPAAPVAPLVRATPQVPVAPAMPAPLPPPAAMPSLVMPPMPPIHVDVDVDIARAMAEVEREIARLDMDAISADVRVAAEAQSRDAQERVQQAQERARERMEETRAKLDEVRLKGLVSATAEYDRGLSALQQRQYDRAIASFDRVIAAKGARVDGALYWKAYAESRIARSEGALATLAILKRDYPQSRYQSDARVLEADVRKTNGQPIDQQAMDANDEIKLYAISGIANTDPERAIPLLEGVLNGSNSLQLKKRAIYVLALSNDTRAHQVLLRYAKGAGNPDLQMEAIRYLATRRDSTSTGAELKEIYQASQDKDVRRAIIDAYRTYGGWSGFNFNVNFNGPKPPAPGNVGPMPSPSPRGRAGTDTGARAAAADELWSLYQLEPDPDLRIQMANVLMSMGAVERLSQIAKTDKDSSVRQRAVRNMGGQRVEQTGAALIDIYNTQQDKDVRRALIQALAGQNNADGLVAIARKETDLALKTEIVRRLSDMAPRNKVAADYLMEVIK